MRRSVGLVAAALVLVSSACTSAHGDQTPKAAKVAFELISDDLDHPVQIAPIPGDSTGIAIAERSGLVLRLSTKDKTTEELIDIEDLINSKQPRGLLGVTFSAAKSGGLFINYIDTQGDLVVGRFPRPEKEPLDENSMSVVIKIAHISRNDHGSQMAFTSDDVLLISTGDGQARTDTNTQSAQSKTTLLGKALRINTRNPTRYEVPQDNPFVSQPPTLGEIWALGFQNPDQLSVDQQSGRIVVVDNSSSVLEINIAQSGQNYGWDIMEGSSCRTPPCATQGLTPPAISIPRTSKSSQIISGGFYRGAHFPNLAGQLIFAESESGRIYAAKEVSPQAWTYTEVATLSGERISALGQGAGGELYAATSNGSLFQLKPE